GGAVACHLKIADTSEAINSIRVGTGSANVILGGDLVVTASNKVLESIKPDSTAVVVNTYEMTTGDFTRDPLLQVPGRTLLDSIADHVRGGDLIPLDAHDYAVKLFGDSIMSNMFLLGMAYQMGKLPISSEAIEEAIKLNGAAVDMNRQAFRFGRLAAHDREALDRIAKPVDSTASAKPETLEDIVTLREALLTDYQDAALAAKYRSKIDWIAEREKEMAPGRSGLAEAAARGYYKLLAYKDEYEVARMYTSGDFEALVADKFDGVRKIEFHLAPPLLSWWKRDKQTGHPYKMKFGPWMMPVFRFLAKRKNIRGTAWDIFGYTKERKQERQMIADYETLLDRIIPKLSADRHAMATQLAGLPMEIKGFGHVKEENYDKAMQRQRALLEEFDSPTPVKVAAE
ncbi:MAG: DUF6537 domain-containing protein, partial [Pseudomonadota bacterium]